MKQRIKAVLALALLLAFATGALAEAPGTDPVITGEAIEPMVGEKDAVELVEQAADDARASSFAINEAAIDLPEGLSVVAEEAFFGCGVRSVYLHDGVTDIGARAFGNCAALCTIRIPETVTRIAEDAFDGCDTDMVIRGISGSTAWQFAQAKGFPFEREDEGIAVLNLSIEDNPAPVPVIHTNQRIVLGGAQTAGHLLCFCHWKNKLHIDVYHGLTDGGGIHPVIKTLLFYYCSAYYGASLSDDGVRLCGDAVPRAEWDDPAEIPLERGRRGMASKWDRPAFQLAGAGIAQLVPDSSVITVRIPEETFMRFNLSNDGSPATIVALLLARTIDALHPDADLPPVIAMCVNQRKALRAPLAHQSLVGDVRLPYAARIKGMDFSLQATCFRGMVTLQTDADMVLDEIREYQALVAQLKAMKDPRERQAHCVRQMEALSRCVTATVSYVGKADLGDAERYIQEFDALPSTALPSTHVPLTIEMSAVNGCFFLDFIQYFHEEDYFNMFIRQLRDNCIDYDVLDVSEARYPRVDLYYSQI